MSRALIVLAHPEPGSFNGAWARASGDALHSLGWDVDWSDLCAMRFDPVEGPGHYGAAAPFDALRAQDAAAKAGTLPGDVRPEVEKIRAADLVLFHFPLWWFGPPAILKGWFDRVLAHGALHTSAQRFDSGMCRGKRVLFCVTTGAGAGESGPHGKEGDTRLLLWPTAYALRYLGFEIIDPVLVHGVHGFHNRAARTALELRLAGVLEDQSVLLGGLDARACWRFNADTEFDAEGRLTPGAEAIWPFIRPLG